MAKGDLVCISQGTAMYDQPVAVDDLVGGIRHYAGLAQKDQTCVVLSDPDDWKSTVWSAPWTQVLLDGRVVWVKSHFLAHLVQNDSVVVY